MRGLSAKGGNISYLTLHAEVVENTYDLLQAMKSFPCHG